MYNKEGSKIDKEWHVFYELKGYLQSIIENEFRNYSSEKIETAKQILEFMKKSLKEK